MFERYAPKTLKKGLQRKRTEMDLFEWLAFLADCDFVSDQVRVFGGDSTATRATLMFYY